ncbi:MAG: cytochrome-c peroxidase [Myxococcota bacterium]|nr:cytochrome-c peroxidase [Myxococcota bacterium]
MRALAAVGCRWIGKSIAVGGVGLLLASNPLWAAAGDAPESRVQARQIFGVLPPNAATAERPMPEARVNLGRMLYFDPRLSLGQDISCNSCHRLDLYGVDGEPTSPGHRGQRGGRNSPTSLNAALHVAQFWDGREPDVEAQAKGPVLNPIEMAMPSEEAVVAVLASIPGYPPLFTAAFPGESDPLNYENMARAIGSFERGLITPSPFDGFMAGEEDRLSPQAVEGLELFLSVGCVSCHNGPLVGGTTYRKLGLIKAYPTEDKGKENVTGLPEDRFVFKVPSLRNVAQTGPWFHDGSIQSLDQAILVMGRHQLGVELDATQRAQIGAFLESLTGRVDPAFVAEPELPENGPNTPGPDRS